MTASPVELPTARGAATARRLARVLVRGVWKIRVRGAELIPRTGAIILAPNHSSIIDGPVLMSCVPRPMHSLVKEEMFHGPVGWVLTACGQIPVDRDDPGRSALRAALGVLEADRMLVVFPEGTRGTGDFSELRTGLAWFALRSGAPVVPVFIEGTAKRSRTLGGLPGLRARLDVVFGEPVMLPGGARTRTALDSATALLQKALVAHREAALPVRPTTDVQENP